MTTDGKSPLEIEVLVSEEETAVYVKFTGFEDIDDADDYAQFLVKHLHLLLFDSEVKH